MSDGPGCACPPSCVNDPRGCFDLRYYGYTPVLRGASAEDAMRDPIGEARYHVVNLDDDDECECFCHLEDDDCD